MNDEIILTDIKSMLGISADETAFDDELLLFINGEIALLNQLWDRGEDIHVTKETTWEEYVAEDKFQAIKTLIYLGVKLLFDPPANSFAVEALKSQKSELQYRLNVHDVRTKSRKG